MKEIENIDKDKKTIEIYRKILGNKYNNINDDEILKLANRIKWFCHSFINSHLQDFSGNKTKFLNTYQEKNE